MHEIKLSSRSRSELIDISGEVQGAVTINEGADPAVRSDIEAELDKVIPWNDGYAHGGPMIDARKTMETDV